MKEQRDEGPQLTDPTGRGPFSALLIVLAALLVAFVFLFATKALHRNEEAVATGPSPNCAASRTLANRLNPLVHGHIAASALSADPERMPELAFAGPDSKPRKLVDFRGRNILLNLWASCCIPCRIEMPALDRLEGKEGGNAFQVVAIDVATNRFARSKAFWKEIGVKHFLYRFPSRCFRNTEARWKSTRVANDDPDRQGRLRNWFYGRSR